MENMNYKELQMKAKKLGMEKVVGKSMEELISFISQCQQTDTMPKNTEETTELENDKENVEQKNNDEKLKDIVAQTRGFKDYNHIKDYLQSDNFERLSKADRTELKSWFEAI